MTNLQTVQLEMPPVLTSLSGARTSRRPIWVYSAGKPPKLRFRPGNIIRERGQLFEIIFAYRIIDKPSEWLYCCEERDSVDARQPNGQIEEVLNVLGAGDETPRVVKEVFKNFSQASSYFVDIPTHRDRVVFSTKRLLKAQVVSSGPIVPSTALGS